METTPGQYLERSSDFYMTDGIIIAVKTHKSSIYP